MTLTAKRSINTKVVINVLEGTSFIFQPKTKRFFQKIIDFWAKKYTIKLSGLKIKLGF